MKFKVLATIRKSNVYSGLSNKYKGEKHKNCIQF